jgi:hypothetical protein
MELQLDATITVLLISKISLALLKMGKVCPKHVELILEINKTVIVASSWSSIFTLPTLMMHGQTRIKFTIFYICTDTIYTYTQEMLHNFNIISAG